MSASSLPHVLVVDDEPIVRESLFFALKDSYVVHSAASGIEACAVLGRFPIAVMVLDAILGGEHGLNLVPRFRRLSPAPIVLLTGHGSEELAAQALWAHVDGYLKKPPSLAGLHEAIGRLVPRVDTPSDLAARAHQHLEEHMAKPFRAADLAGQLGVSEIHLRRCFRAAYGKTPHRYLTEVRMRRAAELLSTTGLGIDQIAWEVGYASSTRFGKVFKQVYALTPSEYRAGQREFHRTDPR